MVSIWNQIPPLDIGGFSPTSDIPPCCSHGSPPTPHSYPKAVYHSGAVNSVNVSYIV